MKKLILGLMLAALGANADLVDINGAKVERNTPYDIVDGESGTVGEFLDVGGFAMQTNVYDKSETDAKIDEKVSALDFYKKSEVDAKIADEGVKRQDGDTAAINSAKTYIDDKLKTYEASPNYAVVSNAAMTALQPAATNGLAKAADVYKKTETYTQKEIDTKVANATPSDYATVKSKAESALQSENDPKFYEWRTNSYGVALGWGALAARGKSMAIGYKSKAFGGAMAFGQEAVAKALGSVAIGACAYVPASRPMSINFANDPTGIYFNACGDEAADYNDSLPEARSLQSYLDERATTNDLAAVKTSVPVISATDATFSNAVNAAARALVKSKLESLDRAKSSIGETIAALQSIYNETETK